MDIKKAINNLNLERIRVSNIEYCDCEKEYAIIEIHGGFNGRGNWKIYLSQLSLIIESVNGWIITIKNDCLDDVWTALIGTYEV